MADDKTAAAEAADEYDPMKDLAGCFDECYRAIRERMAAGGPGWVPRAPKDGEVT